MGLLDDVLSSDAALFCDPDSMPGGEAIVYTPKGGVAKNINANVFRNGPQPVPGATDVFAPSIDIFIPNNATTGVTSININGDKVTLPERKGETAKELRVNAILDQDGGIWHLALT